MVVETDIDGRRAKADVGSRTRESDPVSAVTCGCLEAEEYHGSSFRFGENTVRVD